MYGNKYIYRLKHFVVIFPFKSVLYNFLMLSYHLLRNFKSCDMGSSAFCISI